jgi:predicted secreted protein
MHPVLAVFLLAILPFTGNTLAETSDTYNRIRLSVEAAQEIENDLLVAELYAEFQAGKAVTAAKEVNKAINWAVDEAKKIDGIEVRTLNYSTNAVYDKTHIKAWRASQSLRLESGDSEKLGELIAVLQEKLAMRNLAYQVSRSAQDAALKKLTDEAIQAFRQRAQQSARAFGFEDFRLVDISINNGNVRPPVPYYSGNMMAMEAKAAPAVIEAGSSTLTVSVSGTIELFCNKTLGGYRCIQAPAI